MRITLLIATIITAAGIAASVQAPVSAASSQCLDGNQLSNYNVSFTRTTGTITTKDGKPLCKDTTITLQTFTLASSWNRQYQAYTYPNQTAYPQMAFADTSFTIPANQSNFSKTATVNSPDKCKSIQVDFYVGAGYKQLNGPHDDDARNIKGLIFNGEGSCETTPTPTKPTETPSPTPASPVVETTEAPTELPKTGMSSIMLPFGIATVFGTALAAYKRR